MFTFVISKNVPLLIQFVVDEPSMVTPFSNRTFVVVKDFGGELKVSILPVPGLPISAYVIVVSVFKVACRSLLTKGCAKGLKIHVVDFA